MDNKEKQELVTTISMILIFVSYWMYVYKIYVAPNVEIVNDFKFWGKGFLYMIPITIVAQIILHIIFAIINKIVTNEDIESKTDERDRFIELKALRISHWVFTAGFIFSMVTLVLEMPIYAMFITLIVSGFVSAIASGIAKIHFYRKGF